MSLKICDDFFGCLNAEGIRYCHWKSNIRLQKALSGKTDLDLLVHRDDKARFEEAMRRFGFKEIISPPEKQFPGLEDYLGFDFETGRLVHLHIHYNLVLGQRYIKNHHLPIEEIFLQNLIMQDNVAIPCPELELILLVIRAHMKIDSISLLKHLIKDFSGSVYVPFPMHIEEELDELISKSDIQRLKDILRKTGLPLPEGLITGFIARYSARKLKSIPVFRDCLRIFSSLKMYRRRTSLGMYLEYISSAVWDLPGMAKFRPSKKKTLPGKGRVYAFVGADGSGKSTLVEDLEKWLLWKLSVRRYYFGIPKIKLIEATSRVAHVCKKFGLVRSAIMLETCLWIFIARHRRALSEYAREAGDQGNIVISDRFPLKEFHRMADPMDGPRLLNNKRQKDSVWASIENYYYSHIMPPDRIFVLKVTLDEVRRRKTDLDIETHRAKVEAVNALDEKGIITVIDANQPYQDVQLQVKRMIWADF